MNGCQIAVPALFWISGKWPWPRNMGLCAACRSSRRIRWQASDVLPSELGEAAVTTHRIGYPSDLRRQLEGALPRQNGTPVVRVTPRDRAHRKCAAWSADHYEVQAYYTTTDSDSLDRLEKALRERPGVY